MACFAEIAFHFRGRRASVSRNRFLQLDRIAAVVSDLEPPLEAVQPVQVCLE